MRFYTRKCTRISKVLWRSGFIRKSERSNPSPAAILSDQNRYTHLKPLRNQGFQRFYALFFQSVFYRYTRAFKSVRKDLNSFLG